MQSYLQELIAYLSFLPALGLAVVFLGALLEAVAVIGTVIPGSAVVFIGGIVVGLGVLDPWSTATAAVVGAILGNGFSFWLGRRHGENIRSAWPLRKYPELFERGRAYFQTRGTISLFMARFLGPMRTIVPLIAGSSDMPVWRFYAVNAMSAVAWAAAHLIPGLVLGASLQWAGAVSPRLVVLLALCAAVLWSLRLLWRAVGRHGVRVREICSPQLLVSSSSGDGVRP